MRLRSRQTFSDPRGGFTLLEVTIAMTFVAVLIGGITLSISTCLKVWERSRETADLNQEARAIIEVISRDVRGAYLGLNRNGGYFLAGGSLTGKASAGAKTRQTNIQQTSTGATLEFTTESSTITRAARLPPKLGEKSGEQAGPPATDFVAVRYELLGESATERAGLYRTSWVAPSASWLQEQPPMSDAVGVELVSDSVVDLRFRYYDGDKWVDAWATTADNLRLPNAVAIQFTILDTRKNEHVYESVIYAPTS